jgi:tetratricopeptide (TPR) repeat protein
MATRYPDIEETPAEDATPIVDYLLYYQHFLVNYIGKGRYPWLWFWRFWLGFTFLYAFGEPEYYAFIGQDPSQGWRVLAEMVVLALPVGFAANYLAGWAYQALARMARRPARGATARALHLYASIPVYAVWFLNLLLHLMLVGEWFFVAPTYFLLDIATLVLIGVASGFSIWRSYIGAVQLFGARKHLARASFVVIPIALHLIWLAAAGYYFLQLEYQDAKRHKGLAENGVMEGQIDVAITEYHLALSHLRRNVGERQDIAGIYSDLSELYRYKRDTAHALACLAQAADFIPFGTSFRYLIEGRKALLQGHIEIAINHFKNATLDTSTRVSEPHAELARIFSGEAGDTYRDPVKALRHNQHLFALYPQSNTHVRNLLENLYELKRFDEILELTETILEAQPMQAQAAYYAGLVYRQRDDPEQALAFLRHAVQLDPTLQTDALVQTLKALEQADSLRSAAPKSP